MTIELELPAWYVDSVELDDLGTGAGAPFFLLVNRNPEPDETGVQVGADLIFELVCDNASTPTTTGLIITITIDGGTPFVAYTGGAFQAGWNGPRSATSLPNAKTLRVVVDPTVDFGSQVEVDIRVQAQTSGGAQTLDETYTVTIEDNTPPILATATARGQKKIRLVFNEPVLQVSPTGEHDATNPANYTFDRPTAVTVPGWMIPSVPIEAVSVEVISALEVEITTDIEMTPGVDYVVYVLEVEDVVGNEIVAPNNQATFVGWVPPIPAGRSFDAWGWIPDKNKREDNGDLEKFIRIVSELCGLMLSGVDAWTDIIDPDRAEEIFLDAMLVDLGNPFEFDLTINQKRKLIRILVAIYRQKGTAIGIVNVVRFFLGIEVEVNAFSAEGWDLGIDELGDSVDEGTAILGPGTSFALYSFEIVSPVVLTAEQREQIRTIANYMKPAHTHLVQIIEPVVPEVFDHLELGISVLGDDEWDLHG